MTILDPARLKALLIDLDDTLYDSPELHAICADNIRAYMVSHLGFHVDEVADVCNNYYVKYGTTLAGLVANGHSIDYDEWHAHVHGTLPYDEHLKPDPKLKVLLDSIHLSKWIFTNADIKHANRCLDILGLQDCFQGIICFESIMEASKHLEGVVCKPSHHAMELALQQAGGLSTVQVAFFDDSSRNIASAFHNGVYSVIVGSRAHPSFEEAHIRVGSMHDLPKAMPWLWHADAPPKEIGSPRAEEDVRNSSPVFVQA